MNRFDRLRAISNNAAKQASEDCASKIKKLTNNQLDEVLAELKNSRVNKREVEELMDKVQASTDKNKAVREFIDKSENICKAVTNIIGKMIIIS